MNSFAFQLRAVDKSFGSGATLTSVLKQVDFAGRPGEMLFLVGPSGCGSAPQRGVKRSESLHEHTLQSVLKQVKPHP
jgi:ABC-type nitrate/sulfonate/bicarbonate transport system ATPase subunit